MSRSGRPAYSHSTPRLCTILSRLGKVTGVNTGPALSHAEIEFPVDD